MAGGGGDEKELDQTPTWAVATIAAVIIIISIILEKVLHKIGHWFTDRRKKALFEALENIKGELMVLGFISLLLTFFQAYIAKICIPKGASKSMLPCSYRGSPKEDTKGKDATEEHRRRLLWNDRRLLAGAAPASCKKGYEPLISVSGLHQLHIFIFFLAVFHVVSSAITMTLGRLKIRGWKHWERETSSHDYEFSNDPSRFRLTHETSFVRLHNHFWTKNPFAFYFVCFFRQFFRSVRKVDYTTLRHAFISVHLSPGSKFDFQRYIKRSLEDDFKVVVGISPLLWTTAVMYLLINVHGWQTLFWASIIPLIIVLAVGTKLQSIITQMALDIQDRHAVVLGMPVVQVNDTYFWFHRPHLVLHLLHFTLFQNAFQIIYFIWIWSEFGLRSCFHENFNLIIVRLCLWATVQFMCSYVTLPLYALVTQMGSTMKKSIFEEQTAKALKNWHKAAVRKKKEERLGMSPMNTPSASPAHPLHRYKTTGHSNISSVTSRRHSDTEMSDMEADMPTSTANLIGRVEDDSLESGTMEESSHDQRTDQSDQNDFSFVKPAPQNQP